MTKQVWFFRSIHDSRITIYVTVFVALAALAGCGAETATTAATGAAIKKQEVDQGKKTLEQAQQKLEQAAQQVERRADRDRDASNR